MLLYKLPRGIHGLYFSPLSVQLDRLTKDSGIKTPDIKRTQTHSSYKEMGIVNSFAWKGYN